MWRLAYISGSVLGRYYPSRSPSYLNLNAASAMAMSATTCASRQLNHHPHPPPLNSHLFNLTRFQVLTLLEAKCKTGFDRLGDARMLFDEMLRFHPLPSVPDFNRLLTGVVKMEEYIAAVVIYREMCFLGIPIDQYTMSIVINSFCHLHKVDLAFATLAVLFKLGFEADVVTLTNLIRGLFKADRIAEAMELFRTMVIEKTCNEATYGTMINGLCKSGNTCKAVELLRLAEKEGFHKPNTVMYSTIIYSLCRDGKMDEALELLYEMSANATPPNIVTYNSIIQGLCKFDRWKEAKSLIIDMTNKRIYPNVSTFNIVNAFSKEGCVEQAEDLRKIMENLP